MAHGHVKWWEDNKGFGFITDTEGQDIFVACGEIQSEDYPTLEDNQSVEFEIMDGPRGPMAKNVRNPGEAFNNNLCVGYPPSPETVLKLFAANVKIFRENSIRKLEYEINSWIRYSGLRTLSASMTNADEDGLVSAIVVFSQE